MNAAPSVMGLSGASLLCWRVIIYLLWFHFYHSCDLICFDHWVWRGRAHGPLGLHRTAGELTTEHFLITILHLKTQLEAFCCHLKLILLAVHFCNILYEAITVDYYAKEWLCWKLHVGSVMTHDNSKSDLLVVYSSTRNVKADTVMVVHLYSIYSFWSIFFAFCLYCAWIVKRDRGRLEMTSGQNLGTWVSVDISSLVVQELQQQCYSAPLSLCFMSTNWR